MCFTDKKYIPVEPQRTCIDCTFYGTIIGECELMHSFEYVHAHTKNLVQFIRDQWKSDYSQLPAVIANDAVS